jgi:hypothetical protein
VVSPNSDEGAALRSFAHVRKTLAPPLTPVEIMCRRSLRSIPRKLQTDYNLVCSFCSRRRDRIRTWQLEMYSLHLNPHDLRSM